MRTGTKTANYVQHAPPPFRRYETLGASQKHTHTPARSLWRLAFGYQSQ